MYANVPGYAQLANQKIVSIRVVELLLIDTGTYNQQYLKPYESSLDAQGTGIVVDRISEAVAKGASITSNTFLGLGTSIVAPSAGTVLPVGILNGWNNQRMRFKLTIDTTNNAGSVVRYIYIGYTSNNNLIPGISFDGPKVDPTMVFKVNTVTRTRVNYQITPHGEQRSYTTLSTCNVLVNPNWSQVMSDTNMYMMRPMDVISHRATQSLRSINTNFIDTSSIVTSRPEYANLAAGNISDYASSIVSNALKVGLVNDPSNKGNPYHHAKQMASDKVDNPLFDALCRIRGTIAADGTFTIAELMQMDPNTDNMTAYAPLDQNDVKQVHRSGQTCDWNGSDITTQAATIIANGIPGIMARLGLIRLALNSTNSVIGSIPTTTVSGAVSVNSQVNMDVQSFSRIKAELITRIEYDIMNPITFGFDIEYYVGINADLNGEMWISIGLSGEPPRDYVFPCFSSSAMTPVLTHDMQKAYNLAGVFGGIIDECVQNIPSMQDDYASFESNLV
jgi:hypothetical protein